MPVPFIVPAVGWGLTALGGATGAYSLSQMPKNMRKDIVRDGPDIDSGEFETNPIQDLFVDKDSLMDSYNKRQMKLTKKDDAVQRALGLDPSLQVLNGQDPSDFLNINRTKIKRAQDLEAINQRNLLNDADYKSPGQVESRRVQAEQRSDLINEQRLSREDTNNRFLYSERVGDKRRAHEASENKLTRNQQSELADNRNDMQMQMSIMSNDLQEKRMNYDRETRRMDKRTAAIAQLMSGLGSLGGAFSF